MRTLTRKCPYIEFTSYVILSLSSVIESAYRGDILPDLYPLRKAIIKLQEASLELDEEKAAAEKAFCDAMKKISRWRKPRVVRRIIQWIKEHLGVGTQEVQESLRFRALSQLSSVMDSMTLEANICKSRTKGPLCDFVRAAKRVRVVNQKLAMFERGFISEDGIKDREWYKHLVVAPGKHTGNLSLVFL